MKWDLLLKPTKMSAEGGTHRWLLPSSHVQPRASAGPHVKARAAHSRGRLAYDRIMPLQRGKARHLGPRKRPTHRERSMSGSTQGRNFLFFPDACRARRMATRWYVPLPLFLRSLAHPQAHARQAQVSHTTAPLRPRPSRINVSAARRAVGACCPRPARPSPYPRLAAGATVHRAPRRLAAGRHRLCERPIPRRHRAC